MIAEQFIDRLEQQGLLDAKIISQLRKQVEKKKNVTADKIARYLVEKGHLTKFQAIKLVGETTSLDKAAGNARLAATREMSEDELGFAESPEEEVIELQDASTPAESPQKASSDTEQLTALDPDPEPAAKASTAPGKKKGKGKSQPKPEAAQPPSSPPPAPLDLDPVGPPASPLDDLSSAPLDNVGNVFGDNEPAESLHGPRPVGKIKQNQWDSLLLLVGGTALLVLIVIGVVLFLSLTRGVADEIFAQAEEAYNAGNYGYSIEIYEKFIEKFPRHEKVSIANVRIGTARLRQSYKVPEQGLKTANTVLPNIENEEAFADTGRPELASMLPKIAEGFVMKGLNARTLAEKEQLLGFAQDAMKLVRNPVYLPATQIKAQLATIQGIEENMGRIQREINRSKNLASTLSAMNTAIDAGQTLEAFQAREALLKDYPGLETDEGLMEAVGRIGEIERGQVKLVDANLTAATEDHPSDVESRLILATAVGNPATGVTGQAVYFNISGSIYALDATSGEVLWSRFVGHETRFHPLPLNERLAESDVLLVDGRRSEIVRVKGRTGDLVWRIPMSEPFNDPVFEDEKLFVTSKSGKIFEFDLNSGQCQQATQLPQATDTSPGSGGRRPYLYAVGQHDNLYVVSRDSGQCEEVYYIGHKRGSVTVPPVMALGYLFICENYGAGVSRIHVLRTDESGLKLEKAQAPFVLTGQVVLRPTVTRRRILIVTDRRHAVLYDVDPNRSDTTPVTKTAEIAATRTQPTLSYANLLGGYMFMADDQLTKYQVQLSSGKLPVMWSTAKGDTYVSPIQSRNQTVFYARRKLGASGVTVAAVNVEQEEPQWQTDLAVSPGLMRVAEDGQTLNLVTSKGQLFNISADQFGKKFAAKPAAQVSQHKPWAFTEVVQLADGRLVMAPPRNYDDLLLYDPKNKDLPLRLTPLKTAGGKTTSPPVAFGDGVLVAVADGQVVLVNPETGGDLLHPFNPSVGAGRAVQWIRPAVLGSGGEFVIVDDAQRIYKVGMKPEPERNLAEIGSNDLPKQLAVALGAVGNAVYGVYRSGAGDLLVSIKAEDLTMGSEWELEGRVSWGPARIGESVLVATDRRLLCLGPDHQELWTAELDGGMVGQPLVDSGQLLVSSAAGAIRAFDLATGQAQGMTELGVPLVSGPVKMGGQLVVATSDGSLVLAPLPRP